MSSFKKRGREQTGTPTSNGAQKDTVISASSVMEGKFSFGGPAIIAGHLRGSIQSTDLLVLEKTAVIEADIIGVHIIVKGKVRGALKASESLELTSTADFEGEVSSPTLKVAEGAQFRAAMEISRTPIEARPDATPQRTAGQPTPTRAPQAASAPTFSRQNTPAVKN
jgi:cytoskeletal protein CcmA (bactofilin family)